jgi:hypothetical protein
MVIADLEYDIYTRNSLLTFCGSLSSGSKHSKNSTVQTKTPVPVGIIT